MKDDDKALVEVMKDAVLHGRGFIKNGKHIPIDNVYLDPRDARIEALSAENEKLRSVVDALLRHEASGFWGLDSEKNKRASYRGVIRRAKKVRAELEGSK